MKCQLESSQYFSYAVVCMEAIHDEAFAVSAQNYMLIKMFITTHKSVYSYLDVGEIMSGVVATMICSRRASFGHVTSIMIWMCV